MQTTDRFVWRDDFALGLGSLDAHHREFVDCVQALIEGEDAELANALDRFVEHAMRHFGDEDRWMADTAYPSAGCHLDEHAAVLKSVAEVQILLAQGKFDIARRLGSELARWFPEHAQVMDQGLARWFVQRQLGGAPIVIRRKSVLAA